MMSLLRIIFGVLLGVGFIVSLAYLGEHFPRATGRVVFVIMGCGLGSLGIWTVLRCLRRGFSGGGNAFRYYKRSDEPFRFWLFVSAYSLGAIFGFTVAVCSVFVPKFVGLR